MRVLASMIVTSLLLTACAETSPQSQIVGTSPQTQTVETSPHSQIVEVPPQTQIDDCTPTVLSGDPLASPNRRIEDIIEVLTGERQTGDDDPVEETINDPNFGGDWGDFQGGVVVAVLDCSKVDASELARIAGGTSRLHLIEVPHTFRQVDSFRDALAEELSNLGILGETLINSTITGRFIEVRVLDPGQLPEDFGNEIPEGTFTIVTGELDSEG